MVSLSSARVLRLASRCKFRAEAISKDHSGAKPLRLSMAYSHTATTTL